MVKRRYYFVTICLKSTEVKRGVNMKKILPIDEQPDFREVHTSAYMLSMLKPSDLFSDKWLLNNCISIYFAKKFNNTISYDYHPLWFLKYFKSRISFYYPNKNITAKIKKYIDKGFYVILFVNERYIPYRYAYNKRDQFHDILIYGYDEASFYTIAYDNENKYCSHKCLFSQIEIAHKTHPDRSFKFYALKVNKKFNFDRIRIKTIYKKIWQYLNPTKNNEGINSYVLLREKLLVSTNRNLKIDIRSFRLIFERAKALRLVNKYIISDKSVEKQISNLIKNSEILFYLILKYNETMEKSLVSKILDRYDEYVEQDFEFFSKLLDIIDKKMKTITI